jgi:hypothetical protein
MVGGGGSPTDLIVNEAGDVDGRNKSGHDE